MYYGDSRKCWLCPWLNPERYDEWVSLQSHSLCKVERAAIASELSGAWRFLFRVFNAAY
jgi:hypothetical protein